MDVLVTSKIMKEDMEKILAQVREGNEVVITENEEPIARVTSMPRVNRKRTPGNAVGIAFSIAPDFDEIPAGFLSSR